MKEQITVLTLALVTFAWLDPAAADALKEVLDPGGVAFEWPAPGSWNAPRKVISENLLKAGDAEGTIPELGQRGGWHISSWLGSKARDNYPLPGTPMSDIADGMGRSGSRAFHLRMSADASPIVTAVWATNVTSDKPGPYRISGWARCGALSKDGGSLEVTFQSRNKSGQLCGEAWQTQRSKTTLVPVAPGDWAPFHVDVMSMPDIVRISLILAQRGPGELYLDDLSMVKTEADSDIHVIACSTGLLDGTVAIGSNDLFCGGMWAQNESGRQVKSPRLEFELPEGVRLIPPTNKAAADFREERATIDGQIRLRTSIPWGTQRILMFKTFPSGISEPYCLYTDLSPRNEPYAARARVIAEGYEGPWWRFRLRILPCVEPVAPSKRVHIAGSIPKELEGQAAQQFVEACSRWGLNAGLCAHENKDMHDALKKSGLYMVSIDWFWRNNFQFMHKPWTKELVPADGWWVGQDGGGWGMCPEYIAQGHTTDTILKPYYRKVFVEDDLYTAWCTNWEPDLWIRKGCFCPRCRKSFAAFAKLPEAEVMGLEDKALVDKYPGQWQSYRRDLNNRLMRLAYSIFDDLGKERGRPIPALLAVSPRVIVEPEGEMDIHPVLREAKGISSWSYEGVDVSQGAKGIVNHLKVAEQSEQVMDTIRECNKSPDFMYFHTLLGSFGSLVTTPEEMELDLLSAVLVRPWCLKLWDMPMSYDYRYVRALGRACRVIAAHEDMIYDGQKSKDVPMTPLSITHTGDETRKNLWARSFARDGKRLYALFNFDRNHPVFFALKPEAGPGRWVFHDPVNRRVFTSNPSSSTLSDSDLTQGVCLHLGAARAMFLVLEPAGDDAKRWEEFTRIDCKAIESAFKNSR